MHAWAGEAIHTEIITSFVLVIPCNDNIMVLFKLKYYSMSYEASEYY